MPLLYSAIAQGEKILVSNETGIQHFEDVAMSMFRNIPDGQNTKVTYTSENYLFHCIIDDSIIYLCVAEVDFGRRIPYAYLEKIKLKFKQTVLPNRAQFAKSHEFDQDFQHVMAQEMEKHSSGEVNDQVSELRAKVDDVKVVLIQNVEKVLQRGEGLDVLMAKTDDLIESAQVFHSTSKKISRKMWWKNVKFWIILTLVGLVILTIIILFATDTIPTGSSKS